MNSKWARYRVGDIAEVKSGKRLPHGHVLIGDKTPYPYIRLVDISNGKIHKAELKFLTERTRAAICRYIVRSHDVCLAIVGHTIGMVFYVDPEWDGVNLTENAARLTNFSDLVNSKYLYYYLMSQTGRAEIISRKVGSAQGKLPLYNIKSLEFSAPPRAMQDHFVQVLDLLSLRIDLLRDTNVTLEAIAQALFKSWFVDFDPVHAKVEGFDPEGIDAATATLFPDSFEESELEFIPKIPKGWRVLPLEAAYEINPSRKLKKGEAAPYLDMASVGTRSHVVSGVVDREMGSGTKFTNGDTLLARITPCLENGKSAFVDFLANDQIGWGSTEFVVLRPRAPLPAYHGYLLARHTTFREYAIQSMSGTSGRQRVQNDVLGRYPVVVPTGEVAEVFGGVVGSIQQRISANQEQVRTLTQLRDTLLPRLISGQLRLPEAEELVEEACA